MITRGTGTAAQHRPARGRQDRDDAAVPRRVVRRATRPSSRGGLGRATPTRRSEMTSVHGRKVTGGSFPAEIWAAFMSAALSKGTEEPLRAARGAEDGAGLRGDRRAGDRRTARAAARRSCSRHRAGDVRRSTRSRPRSRCPKLVGHDQGRTRSRSSSQLKLKSEVVEKPTPGVWRRDWSSSRPRARAARSNPTRW